MKHFRRCVRSFLLLLLCVSVLIPIIFVTIKLKHLSPIGIFSSSFHSYNLYVYVYTWFDSLYIEVEWFLMIDRVFVNLFLQDRKNLLRIYLLLYVYRFLFYLFLNDFYVSYALFGYWENENKNGREYWKPWCLWFFLFILVFRRNEILLSIS